MTFAQVAASTTSSESGAVNNHTVALPTGISPGDLLIVVWGQGANAPNNPTFPAGWTKVAATMPIQNLGGVWAYKIADGSEGSSINVFIGQACQSAHQSFRITGHDSANPPQSQSFWTNGSSAAPNPNSFALGVTKDFLLIAAAIGDSGFICTAAPTNFTNLTTADSGSTTDASVAVSTARRNFNTNTADSTAFTLEGSEGWLAIALAVHPEPAGSVTVVAGNVAAVATVPTPAASGDANVTAGNVAGSTTINTPVVTTTTGVFPQVAATNTSIDASAVTSHTVNLPTGINAGDLLIVVFGQSVSQNQPTFPAGWTRMFPAMANNIGGTWAYRVADGLEGATITVTTGAACQAAHWSARITGHDVTQPPESQSFWDSGTTGHPNPGTVVPTGGAKDYLFIVAAVQDSGVVCTAAPTSFTNLQTASSGATADVSCGVSIARRQLNAASGGASAFTAEATTDSWLAQIIAVHPTPLTPPTRTKPSRVVMSTAVQNRASRW